ncbi:hypothetical protein LZ31DRAFT_599015 [Colletotrichum somersetense]|nr:hypothetical protein LZ31DRAFT_599015 [Colletotrichum somersetense]
MSSQALRKPYPNYYIKLDPNHYTKWNLNYFNLELDGNKLNPNLCLCNYVYSLQYFDQSNNTSVDVTNHYISFPTSTNNTNNKIIFYYFRNCRPFKQHCNSFKFLYHGNNRRYLVALLQQMFFLRFTS